MALQSPDRRAGELLRCGKDFLRQLAPWMRRPSDRYSSAGRSDPRQQAARGAGAVRPASGVWFTRANAAGGDALRVAEVADLAREMTRRRRRWQVLFTTGINGRGHPGSERR